jgi:hypothetical protein
MDVSVLKLIAASFIASSSTGSLRQPGDPVAAVSVRTTIKQTLSSCAKHVANITDEKQVASR